MRIGLYPGTFDPIHNGHVDLVRRALKLVDRLVIGVAINSGKGPMFTLEERVAILQEETACLSGAGEIVVLPYEGLTLGVAREVGAGVIVRGLRAVADFEFEFQMTAMNQQLDRDIETVFLMADPRHQAIASRLVKEIVQMGGDVSPFVPPGVRRRPGRKSRPGHLDAMPQPTLLLPLTLCALLILGAPSYDLARAKTAAPGAMAAAPTAADWRTPDPQDILVIDTNRGRIMIELSPKVAPQSAARVRDLARAGFYDGRAFFRVIDNFMDQTGDPTDTGAGGSSQPNLPPEFTFRRDAATGHGGRRACRRHGVGFSRQPAGDEPDARPCRAYRRSESGCIAELLFRRRRYGAHR